MKVLIGGSRTWIDGAAIRRVLSALPKGTVVWHGAARGADMKAQVAANELGLEVHSKRADWARFGMRAGIERTRALFAEHDFDHVYLFWDGVSRGTKFTLEEAERRGVPVTVISPVSTP